MAQAQFNTGGKVVAFRSTVDKARRVWAPSDEPRGQILLFTGVRYERLGGGDLAPGSSNAACPIGIAAERR